MSFRLQFSLRMLLALVSLVAVGVTFWNRPQIAIEKTADHELVYHYRLDKDGKKIPHGPYIKRRLEDGFNYFTEVTFYREGRHLLIDCGIQSHPPDTWRIISLGKRCICFCGGGRGPIVNPYKPTSEEVAQVHIIVEQEKLRMEKFENPVTVRY